MTVKTREIRQKEPKGERTFGADCTYMNHFPTPLNALSTPSPHPGPLAPHARANICTEAKAQVIEPVVTDAVDLEGTSPETEPLFHAFHGPTAAAASQNATRK